MKCGLCDLRKAKRQCPAKKGLICAQCCGEKRVLEIDCPEDCNYLIAGRKKEVEDYVRRVRSMDPRARERNGRIFEAHQDVLAQIEYVIAQERISSHDLVDKDVERALDVLLETYRTEENGVLYEKASDDLRVEPLRRELRHVIESLRNPEGSEMKGIVDPKSSRLQLNVAIECLECIRSLVLSYQSDRNSSSGYVNFLARVLPRKEMRSSIFLA
jgi:hypothetical protein